MEYIVLAVAFIFMLCFYMRFKNFFKVFLFGAVSGLIALFVLGYFAASYISITVFTILTALIVGAPGVLLLVLFRIFFG